MRHTAIGQRALAFACVRLPVVGWREAGRYAGIPKRQVKTADE